MGVDIILNITPYTSYYIHTNYISLTNYFPSYQLLSHYLLLIISFIGVDIIFSESVTSSLTDYSEVIAACSQSGLCGCMFVCMFVWVCGGWGWGEGGSLCGYKCGYVLVYMHMYMVVCQCICVCLVYISGICMSVFFLFDYLRSLPLLLFNKKTFLFFLLPSFYLFIHLFFLIGATIFVLFVQGVSAAYLLKQGYRSNLFKDGKILYIKLYI